MSPVASREAGPKVYRGTGPAQGYVLIQWMGNTFHFVGMRPAAGTAGVGNGRPSLQTWIAPSEISVLPVPHSAVTMAVFAYCQRLATLMMAMLCRGNGFRSNPWIRGETGKRAGDDRCHQR